MGYTTALKRQGYQWNCNYEGSYKELEVKYLWKGWVKKDGVNNAKSNRNPLTLNTPLILPWALFQHKKAHDSV